MSKQPTKEFSLGLKINLIPENRKTEGLNKFYYWLISSGRYILIATELLLFSVFASRFYFDDRIQDEIDYGIKTKLPVINSLKSNTDQFRNLQNRLTSINKFIDSRASSSQILEDLVKSTPADIKLTKIEIEPGQISFEGVLNNVASLETLRKNFSGSSHFSSLEITSISADKQTGKVVFSALTNIKTKNG